MNRLQRRRQAHGGPLLGVAAYFYDPVFIEIAARLGYHAAWIEMEHGPMSVAQAADLTRIAQGAGLLAMIRVPDSRRDSVLRAAECGPDILDVPMANTPDVIADLVAHARYPPLGDRGFFSVSRAVHYGITPDIVATQQQVNDDLCLMVQIETREAADRADELCAVDGADIFIGPADLSASLGLAGQQGHARVRETGAAIVAAARRHGKSIAVASRSSEYDFWVEQDVDLLYCTNDIAAMRLGAEQALNQVRASLDRVKSAPTADRRPR